MQRISVTNETLLSLEVGKKGVECQGKSVKYFSRYDNWENKKRKASSLVPPRQGLSVVSTRSWDSSDSSSTGVDFGIHTMRQDKTDRGGRFSTKTFEEEEELLRSLQKQKRHHKKGVKGKKEQLPQIGTSSKEQVSQETLAENLQNMRNTGLTNGDKENKDWKYGIDFNRGPRLGFELTRPYTFSYLPLLNGQIREDEKTKTKRTGKKSHTGRQHIFNKP